MDISHRMVSKKVHFSDVNGKPLAEKEVHVKQTNHSFLFGCGAFDFLSYLEKKDEEFKTLTDYWLDLFLSFSFPPFILLTTSVSFLPLLFV